MYVTMNRMRSLIHKYKKYRTLNTVYIESVVTQSQSRIYSALLTVALLSNERTVMGMIHVPSLAQLRHQN